MDLNELLETSSHDLILKACKCKNVQELKSFLESKDILLDSKKLDKVFVYLKSYNKKKLDIDDLDSISGGKGNPTVIVKTVTAKKTKVEDSLNEIEYNTK